MILGEAPGYREDDVGRPFSGKSGRLLDEVLEKNRLSRNDAFISNVAKCRPEDNRTPTRGEIKACRHYLDDEVEAVQPEFILLLGNSALSLLRKSGIMKHRGEIYGYGNAKVLATVHPAAVLRNPHFHRLFESDISAFSRMVHGESGATPPRVFLVRDRKSLTTLCRAILASDAVAYDLETTGVDELADDAQIVSIGVAVKTGG
jgi:DNA polymerase